MTVPLLSVVVPFYNTEAYFRECLSSLYNECRWDARIEIILVDDGSTDGSAAIAAEYAQRLPERIHVVTQKNQGQSLATNNGIKMAQGTYIGFADSDDWVDPGMYTAMLDTALRSDADMVICNFKKVFADGTSKPIRYIDTGPEGLDPQVRHDVVFSIGFSPWNKLVRRDLFAQDDLLFPEGMLFQDLVVFVLMASRVHRIVNTGQASYNYRIREGSLIHSWNDSVYDVFRAFDMLRDRLAPPFGDALVYLAFRELLFLNLPRYFRRSDADFDTYFTHVLTYIRSSFPGWRSNRYLAEAPRWRRWYILAVLQGRKWPVTVLAFLKKRLHR